MKWLLGCIVRRWFPGWAALLLCCSCASSLESARPRMLGADKETSRRCQSLDSTRTAWGAVAKGAAVLAGASGLSMLPIEPEDKELRIGVAAGGIAAAAVAATAVYVSESAGQSYVRECVE